MNKFIFFIISVILITSFASASYDLDNYSIETEYILGDQISGWINLSLNLEPSGSIFSDSEGNSMTLMEFVTKTGYIHTCSITGCLSDYISSAPSKNKEITLSSNEEKIIGFAFDGIVKDVLSVSFDITSTAPESDVNQLKIDILNDGTVDTGNTKVSASFPETTSYGNYNPAGEIESEVPLIQEPSCQEIELKEAPGFNIGAWIKKTNDGENNVKMSIYSSAGIKLKECTIYSIKISEEGSEASCSTNILIPEKDDYYVCIAKELGSAEYNIKGYTSSSSSKNGGFRGAPASSREKVGSYHIYSQPRKFDPIGVMTIENELPNTDQFSFLIKEYISEKYPGSDCKKTGCYVPMRLISAEDQIVNISNIKVKYEKEGFGSPTLEFVSDLIETATKISGDYQLINLENIFKTQLKLSTKKYELSFGEDELFSEDISVKSASFDVLPKKTVSNYPTKFTATAVINESIEKWNWNFGDNQTDSTYSNTVLHSYLEEGTYSGSVTFVSLDGAEFLKRFTVVVSSPKELLESEIALMKANIAEIKVVVNSLSLFEKNKLLEDFDLAAAEAGIESLDKRFPRANDSDDYRVLVGDILELDVPTRVIKTPSKKVPFFPSADLMDIDSLKSITNEDDVPNSDSEIANAIIFWEKRNLNLLVSTSDLKITRGDTDKLIVKTFTLSISPIGTGKEYYVIFDPYALEYHKPSEIEELDGTSYLKIDGDKTTLSFSTTSDLDFTELPLTISPKISNLALITEGVVAQEKKSRTGIILLSFLALIVIGLLVYFILQRWYRTKYEKYLFKDKTTLYNVMIYVNNSKAQGVSNEEIKSNLKRSGWSSEQIRYITRKFEGKETGMASLIPKPSSKVVTPVPIQKNPVNFKTQGMFKTQGRKL